MGITAGKGPQVQTGSQRKMNYTWQIFVQFVCKYTIFMLLSDSKYLSFQMTGAFFVLMPALNHFSNISIVLLVLSREIALAHFSCE